MGTAIPDPAVTKPLRWRQLHSAIQRAGPDAVANTFAIFMRLLHWLYQWLFEAERLFVQTARQGHPTCVTGCGRCCAIQTPIVSTAEANYIASQFRTAVPERWQPLVLANIKSWLTRQAGDPIPTSTARAFGRKKYRSVSKEEWNMALPWSPEGKAKRRVPVDAPTPAHWYDVTTAPPRSSPDSDGRYGPETDAGKLAWITHSEPCPFLGSEEEGYPCMIHPLRPLVCRTYSLTVAPDEFCERPLVGAERRDNRLVAMVMGGHPVFEQVGAGLMVLNRVIRMLVGRIYYGPLPWLFSRELEPLAAELMQFQGAIPPERTSLSLRPKWVLMTEQLMAAAGISAHPLLDEAAQRKGYEGEDAFGYAAEELQAMGLVADYQAHDLRHAAIHPVG